MRWLYVLFHHISEDDFVTKIVKSGTTYRLIVSQSAYANWLSVSLSPYTMALSDGSKINRFLSEFLVKMVELMKLLPQLSFALSLTKKVHICTIRT